MAPRFRGAFLLILAIALLCAGGFAIWRAGTLTAVDQVLEAEPNLPVSAALVAELHPNEWAAFRREAAWRVETRNGPQMIARDFYARFGVIDPQVLMDASRGTDADLAELASASAEILSTAPGVGNNFAFCSEAGLTDFSARAYDAVDFGKDRRYRALMKAAASGRRSPTLRPLPNQADWNALRDAAHSRRRGDDIELLFDTDFHDLYKACPRVAAFYYSIEDLPPDAIGRFMAKTLREAAKLRRDAYAELHRSRSWRPCLDRMQVEDPRAYEDYLDLEVSELKGYLAAGRYQEALCAQFTEDSSPP